MRKRSRFASHGHLMVPRRITDYLYDSVFVVNMILIQLPNEEEQE